MSLIKQLWLAVILIMALAFGAGIIINTITSKHYLEQQLEMKNTDNAVSLALSISQMEKDPVAINLMLSAQFDNGHYQYIRLTNPDGKLISERINHSAAQDVPAWFTKLISIQPAPGIAQIQNGWSQYGTLELVSATNFVYLELWRGTLWMLFWSAFIAIICGIIGSLSLKMIVRPLNEMVEMAEAIGEKNFITIKEPKTFEFRLLAQAMNRLSQRIKDILKDQSKLLDQMRIEAHYDATTTLMNRKHFSSRVAAHIANEENFSEGLLVVSHISNLAEINEKLGESETDNVLKRMGLALQAFCQQHPSLLAGRLTGADFAVFSTQSTDSHVLCGQVTQLLHNAAGLESAFPNFALNTISSKLNKSERLNGLKELIAIIKAKTSPTETDIMELINQEDITRYEDSSESEWRTMLNSALEANRLKLAAFPVVHHNGEIIHQESPARIQLTPNGTWLPASEFISWAMRLNLISKLDQLVVETAVKTISKGSLPISLNVSANAMCTQGYLDHISALLKRHPKAAKHLWLEVPEDGVFNNLSQFREFCNIIKPFGCKLGIEHVSTQIGRLGELHDMGLDYIKIDASVIRGIDQNTANKALLKGICLIAHSIGLMTIAEGVQTVSEKMALPELGIDAMTGPAIKVSE